MSFRLTVAKLVGLIQRFKIINYLAGALCFVVIPAFFLNKGANSYLLAKQAVFVEKNRAQLELALDKLEVFAQNDVFAHHLLAQSCFAAEKADSSLDFLRLRIEKLKEQFPGAFSFMVADKAGVINRDLSDQTSFAYLYRQAFSLFSDAGTAFNAGFAIGSISDAEARLGRLKPLLGQLIRLEDLFMPLQSGTRGKSILVGGGKSRYHLWYFPGRKFNLICYISRSFIDNTAGLRWAARQINRADPALIPGFVELPIDADRLFPELNEKQKAGVVLALGRQERIDGDDGGFNENAGFAGRYLSQKLRGFCVFKDEPRFEFFEQKAFFVAFLLKMALVIFLISKVYFLGQKVMFSVRLKLSMLFAFSLLMPISIIMALTFDYVQQKEKEIVSQIQVKGFRLLENIDEKYPWFMKRHGQEVTTFLQAWAMKKPDLKKTDEFKKLWNVMVKRFFAQEVIMVDSDARNYMEGISDQLSSNPGIIKRSGAETIQIFSQNRLLDQAAHLNLISLAFAEDFLERKNRIVSLAAGGFEVNVLLNYLENVSHNPKKDLIAFVGWKYGRLQECFLQKHYADLAAVPSGYRLIANSVDENLPIIGARLRNEKINSLLKLIVNQQVGSVDRIWLGGQDYIAVAIRGKNLDRMLLAVLIARAQVETATRKIRISAALLALIALVIAVSTMFLIRRLIFQPLFELRNGIEALGARNFRHRLQFTGNNELAKLGNAFNHAMETLQELEVARIVQGALFPEKSLNQNKIQILAESLSMTGLEGDYYDYFTIDERHVVIFLGDATGHGIPAALSMAMAKAVILDARHGWQSSTSLMSRLNDVFFHLRQHGAKDFMTALTLLVDSETGQVEIINAGHCFPIIHRCSAASAELLKQVRGIAFGFGRQWLNESHRIQLQPGDSLILYTDGFIEAMNKNEEILGFDGFLNAVSSARSGNCQNFLRSILDHQRRWAEQQQDDQTIVLIRYGNNENT